MEKERKIIQDILVRKSRYFKFFNGHTLEEIVRHMRRVDFPPKTSIMLPSAGKNNLYVFSTGKAKIMIDLKYPAIIKSQYVYGEQEMLVKKMRTATIKAETPCTVWILSRQEFRACMRQMNAECRDGSKFFMSLPIFKNYSQEALKRIEDTMEFEFFETNETISVKSGQVYIISNGHLRITEDEPSEDNEKIVKVLGRGDHFGEDTIGYLSAFFPGVECITLGKNLLHDVEGMESDGAEGGYEAIEEDDEYSNIDFNSLVPVATIGTGFFGRVELVKYLKDPEKTFALKKIPKVLVVKRNQQDHIITEREVLMELKHPFITRCYRTFRCERNVYFLSEACLGGDLWKLSNRHNRFTTDVARFITGCVVEALDYLHNKHIIYRDLKPENLVVDHLGFVKVTDFGLSKRLGITGRTYTYCGTDSYFAPEIVLNQGHDRGVDFWSLGILLYELLSGNLPFDSTDPLVIFDGILGGIEKICFSYFISGLPAETLIRDLCRREPTERIGYRDTEDIRNHKWFGAFHWNALRSLTLPPPKILVPLLKDSCDTSKFEVPKSEDALPPVEESNWDIDF